MSTLKTLSITLYTLSKILFSDIGMIYWNNGPIENNNNVKIKNDECILTENKHLCIIWYKIFIKPMVTKHYNLTTIGYLIG